MCVYREKHRDEINAYRRRKYAKNREHKRRVRAEWYARNREVNRQKRREYYAKHRERFLERQRVYTQRTAGVKENSLYPTLTKEFPNIVFLNRAIPDAYDPKTGMFIELKLASVKPYQRWRDQNEYFPGLFFHEPKRQAKKFRTLSQQIIDYPKPLLVIILDYMNGHEIARKIFT
jgi:hypothetical protein